MDTDGGPPHRAGKPVVDWDDEAASTALVDSRARDGYALLQALEGQKELPGPVDQAARLLATVLGQNPEPEPDNLGGWRIVRRVAKDRVISTVDTEARHGHKTNYSWLRVATRVTPRLIRTVRSSPRRPQIRTVPRDRHPIMDRRLERHPTTVPLDQDRRRNPRTTRTICRRISGAAHQSLASCMLLACRTPRVTSSISSGELVG